MKGKKQPLTSGTEETLHNIRSTKLWTSGPYLEDKITRHEAQSDGYCLQTLPKDSGQSAQTTSSALLGLHHLRDEQEQSLSI